MGCRSFVFFNDWAGDQINGFEDGIDIIDLSQTSLVFDDLSFEQFGLVGVIDAGNANTITLPNIIATDLTDADFLFGE